MLHLFLKNIHSTDGETSIFKGPEPFILSEKDSFTNLTTSTLSYTKLSYLKVGVVLSLKN